uniref:LON peptidase N-terminal domain and RING finger protein 1-like isoform X2 n=1 Tax=Pristiophorus japonicus TaxID=55135 RepID=UPI00398E7006
MCLILSLFQTFSLSHCRSVTSVSGPKRAKQKQKMVNMLSRSGSICGERAHLSAPDDGQSGPSPAEETVGVQVAGDRLDNLELECRRITEGVENLSLAATDCVQGAGVSLTQGAGVSLTQDVSSGQWPIVLQPMEKETTNKLSAEGLSNPGYVEETVVSCSHCPQSVPPALLNISDFDCSLCTRLLFEPVTTPCGHTFCRKCVERCLDYRPRCPLCKEDLRKFLQQRQYPVTQLLNSIITVYFPTEFAERKLLNEREMAELSNLTSNVAIFVCTVAFPGSPCPLHVFEPRYRLMIRQCLETGTKTFGMCVYEPGKIFADYGCMLKIRGSEDLPDGRSLIDTVGGRRFKVLRRSRRDGYNTADVEYLEDKRVEGEELTRLLPFHNRVYEQARDWFDHLPSRFQEQITGHHGSMPDQEENIQASQDGPRWLWWLLAIVPMDPALQTVVLSSTSLNERLIHLQRVLEYLAQNPIQ